MRAQSSSSSNLSKRVPSFKQSASQVFHILTIANDNKQISNKFNKSSQKAKSQCDGCIKFTGPLKVKDIQTEIKRIHKLLDELKEKKMNFQMEYKTLLEKCQQAQKNVSIIKQQRQDQKNITNKTFSPYLINTIAEQLIIQEQQRINLYKLIMKQSWRDRCVCYFYHMLKYQFDCIEFYHRKSITKIHEHFQLKINEIYAEQKTKERDQEQLKQQKSRAIKQCKELNIIYEQFNQKIYLLNTKWKSKKIIIQLLSRQLVKKQYQLSSLQDQRDYVKQELKDVTTLQVHVMKENIKKLEDINYHKINSTIQVNGVLHQRLSQYFQQYQQLIKLVLQRKDGNSSSEFEREMNKISIEIEQKIKKCNQYFYREILKQKQKFNKDFLHLEQCYQKGKNYQKEKYFNLEQTRYFEKESLKKQQIKKSQLKIADKNAEELDKKTKEECKRMQKKKEQAYEALQNYKKEKESQRAERCQQKRHLRDKLRVLQGQRLRLLKGKSSEGQQNTPKKTSPNLLKQLTKPKIKYRFNRHFNDFCEDTDKRHSFSMPPRLKYSQKLKKKRNMSLHSFYINKKMYEEEHRSREQILKEMIIVNLKRQHMQKQRQYTLKQQRNLQKDLENTKRQMTKINEEKEESKISKNQKVTKVMAIKKQNKGLYTCSENGQNQGGINQKKEESIECIKCKWNKLIEANILSYKQNIKGINENVKIHFMKLSSILVNKHFDYDETTSVYLGFSERLQKLQQYISQISQSKQRQMLQMDLEIYQKEFNIYIQKYVQYRKQKEKNEQSFQQNMKLQIEEEMKRYQEKMNRLQQKYQQDPSKSRPYDEKDLQKIERYKQDKEQLLQELRKYQSLNIKYLLLEIQLSAYEHNYKEISEIVSELKLQENNLQQKQMDLWKQNVKLVIFNKIK